MAIAVLSFLTGYSETVSQKEAQQLAQLFFNEVAGRQTPPPKLIYNGRRLTTNRLFTPFYVYNNSTGGFVIISAENKAYPILGFSLKENFDQDKLKDTELALLRSYAMEIEMVRYDTEPIDGAVWAWQHYPEYVYGILKAKYTATDPKISVEEASQLIENSIEKDDAVYSVFYTPEQWLGMIGEELQLKEVTPIALIDGENLHSAVVYARQGDYFKMEMSERNNWLMRLNATESIPANMISVVVNPLLLPLELEEEQPFEIHDAFIAEVYEQEEIRTSKSSIDIPQFDGTPQIKANGGGHFEIILPENVSTVRIYNLAGAMVRRSTYKDSTLAIIDISAEPAGFYFLTAEGESGTPYGFKIYR